MTNIAMYCGHMFNADAAAEAALAERIDAAKTPVLSSYGGAGLWSIMLCRPHRHNLALRLQEDTLMSLS